MGLNQLYQFCTAVQEEAREAARLAREDARVARLAQAAEQARAERLHAHLCRLDPAFAAEHGAPCGSVEEVLLHGIVSATELSHDR